MVDADILTRRDWIGNEWADKLAEKGAELSIVPQEKVDTTNRIYRMVRYIQLRLA